MSDTATTTVSRETTVPGAESEYQAPPRIEVVTPENFDAYVNERVPARPETPEEQEEELQAEDAAKQQKNGSDAPKKGKKHELNERFSELTEARKAAEKRAEELAAQHKAEREAREKAERDARALRDKYEPPKPDELGPEPIPAQFTDAVEYGKALKEWTTDKTRREDAQKAAEQRLAAEQAKVAEDWGKRLEAAKAEIADFEKTVSESNVQISNDVRDAIFDSEVGPQILLQLAKEPELAEKIGKMTVGRALKEIGKLEAKLSGGTAAPAPKSEAQTSVAEISKAPAPISPLRGTSAPASSALGDDGEFHGTYEDWKRLRKAGKIK